MGGEGSASKVRQQLFEQNNIKQTKKRCKLGAFVKMGLE